jgi:S1-C subfamily serine protease
LRAPHARPRPSRSPGSSSLLLDLSALAAKVNPSLVDINVQLSTPNVQAAGTGIVLDASGVVLTNNHVITGASSINVTDIGNGQSYPATVVGYDRAHDIAVLQLQGASGLPAATIGDSGTVAVGDPIAAIGNAGGRGGTPSIVAGTVSALDQTVTVSDEITGSSQQLAGLIEVAAAIEPGDSGGPLIDAAGQVIGVDTAGSTQSGSGRSAGDGLAIPINDAIAISKQIQAGTASSTIHIGATGVLGVLVADTGGLGRHARRHSGSTVPGAVITGLVSGSPAGQAGLAAGDVIVSLDGTAIGSTSALVTALIAHHPGDSVQVTWVDAAGQQHTATVTLVSGLPN